MSQPSETRRVFPVMGHNGGTVAYVPWHIVEDAAEWCYNNHQQSPARLAARGGLDVVELVAVLEHRRWRPMDPWDAWAALGRIVGALV